MYAGDSTAGCWPPDGFKVFSTHSNRGEPSKKRYNQASKSGISTNQILIKSNLHFSQVLTVIGIAAVGVAIPAAAAFVSSDPRGASKVRLVRERKRRARDPVAVVDFGPYDDKSEIHHGYVQNQRNIIISDER